MMLGLRPQLEVTHTTGDMEKWEPAITIDTPRRVSFRWSTGEGIYPAAQWQVGEEGVPAAATSGAVGAGPFAPRTQHRFSIDFISTPPAWPPVQRSSSEPATCVPLLARPGRRWELLLKSLPPVGCVAMG